MMKKLILCATLCLALIACEKKQVNVPDVSDSSTATAATPHEGAGVSVQSGRLHFTAEGWDKALSADEQEEKKLMAYVHSLAGFTSAKEAKKNDAKSATVDCNCATDDEFTNEIVDEFYMVDIDDWTVKVDICNQKFIAVDRLGFTAAELAQRVTDLQSCEYEVGTHVLEFTFDQELYDELEIARAELNGDEAGAEALRRCRDVACSDREDVSWEDPNIQVTPSGSTRPITLDLSRMYLRYNKRIFKGDLVVWVEDYQWGVNLIPQNPNWQAEFGQSDFKEKCKNYHSYSQGSLYTLNPVSHDTEIPRDYTLWRFYRGKHLKAGYGNVTLRVMCTDYPNAQLRGSWMTILF